MLTIDRFEITKKCWEMNVSNCGFPVEDLEFLVCDNGSTDRRIVEYFRPIAHYHRVNSGNEGCNKAFNQLYLRSHGDHIVLAGNDIEMPFGWLRTAVDMLAKVMSPGICGFDWGHGGVPPLSERNGVSAHWCNAILNRVFGTWIMKRQLVEVLGLFHEGYGPYGIEDSDFNERVNRAGFNSFYVPGSKSSHVGGDVGEDSKYRKLKDESLRRNAEMFSDRLSRIAEGHWTEPMPELREPI